MKVAIEGCCHGELDKIYETLEYLEKKNGYKVDILLICGDFQAVRNKSDMECMAVPPKHRKLNTFYKYYSGEKTAPVLTVFIGGNHEASNYLQELPYGGWVAPNIYYMGYAGVVQFGGVRIGGLSGIYKGRDFMRGHYEHPPYTEDTKRSVYHVRTLELFRLKQISRHVDIFLSHDWPRGVYHYGNVNKLLRAKSFFREEIEQNTLGSPVTADLMYKLQPTYWFSAHLHVKFSALIQHQPETEGKMTKFLSLDKCLPRRQFLQVIDIPHDDSKQLKLELDPEWLVILKSTNHLLNLSNTNHAMPGPGGTERYDFTVTDKEMNTVRAEFGGELALPSNFKRTAAVFDPSASTKKPSRANIEVNEQTTLICSMLDLTDPNAVFLGRDSVYKMPEWSDSFHNQTNNAEGDDDVDEDYESEQSFISLSSSEQSFSDKSFSFLSAGNDSFSSVGNPDEIDIDEVDSRKKDSSANVSQSAKSLSTDSSNGKTDEEDELQDILKAQKAFQSLAKSMDSLSDTKSSDVPSNDDDDEDSLELILAAQRKVQAKNALSESGSSMEVLSEPDKQSSKDSTKSDSSLECKALDDSVGSDMTMEEMIAAQKQLREGQPGRGKKEGPGKVMEVSMDEADIEYQEIIAAQKQNQEQLPELQKDFESLKPVFQSSPAVSMEDRVDQQNLSPSIEKTRHKRNEKTSTQQSPMTKKFRRRNQDLYSDPGTEEDE